jgi:hypothetical protein
MSILHIAAEILFTSILIFAVWAIYTTMKEN